MLLNAILQSSLRIAASLVHENCSGSKQFDVWATDYMFSAETSLGAIEPVPSRSSTCNWWSCRCGVLYI